MKSFQVRLPDDIHKQLKERAKDRSKGMVDIIRESLEIYFTMIDFTKEGKKLVVKDLNTKEETAFVILGL